MFTKQSEKLANMLIEKEISKDEDKEIIIYGLSTGIELLFNIITTLALGFIWGLVFESILFLFSFSLIRTYAGGYHCQKAINCYFFSSGIVILVLAIVKFTPSKYILKISIFILLISVPVILKLAPVETPTKLLDEMEKKYFRKKTVLHLSVESIVITILYISKLTSFAYLICLGIMVSAILVLLGYKKIKN